MGLDLLHLWGTMGWFAKSIVGIMALMSVFSLTIMITKFIQIKKSESATRKFAPTFSRAIQEENLDQAIAPLHHPSFHRPPVREEPGRPPVPRRRRGPG